MIFLEDVRPVARVEHTCSLCGRTIAQGETYRRCRLIGDDGPYTFKECAHCRAFMDLTTVVEAAISWGEGYSTDDFCEWEPDDFQGARWQVQWKRQWRRRDGALYPVPERPSRPGSTTGREAEDA